MDILRLLKKAKKGDNNAFYQLLTIHKEQLYQIAFAYLKNEQEALEAMQEVTFRAFKNIKKVKEPTYFSTWLTRVMINYCIDELKHKKRMLLNETEIQKVRFIEENDDKINMETIIKGLEPKLQEIIILKYFQDMTIEQIATQLDHPVGTIKTWLYKALRTLRKQIVEEGEYDV